MSLRVIKLFTSLAVPEVLAAVALGVAGLAISTAWAAAPVALRAESGVREVNAEIEAGLVAGLKSQIAARMQQPEQVFDVRLETLRLEPAVAPGARVLGVQALGLGSSGAKRLDGLFQIPVLVNTDKGSFEHTAVGVMRVTGPVWVAKAPLKRGHVIGKDDLQLVQLPWSRLPNGAAATSLSSLLGQRLVSGLGAGDVLYAPLMDEPFAVRNGDLVELTVLSGPGVIIRSRGKAQQEGRRGDLVRILQPDTKKTLTGVVTGERSVEIRL